MSLRHSSLNTLALLFIAAKKTGREICSRKQGSFERKGNVLLDDYGGWTSWTLNQGFELENDGRYISRHICCEIKICGVQVSVRQVAEMRAIKLLF